MYLQSKTISISSACVSSRPMNFSLQVLCTYGEGSLFVFIDSRNFLVHSKTNPISLFNFNQLEILFSILAIMSSDRGCTARYNIPLQFKSLFGSSTLVSLHGRISCPVTRKEGIETSNYQNSPEQHSIPLMHHLQNFL